MDASFWHQKWEKNEIAFHEGEANALLVKYFNELGLKKGSRLFLPLCGKTRDIAWLLGNGYRVAGAELSEIAIQQLFEELGVAPSRTKVGEFIHYSAPDIDIFVGDIFHLTSEILGSVDAIYDRAALVALPGEMRSRYTAHLVETTGSAQQLLICFDYDQTQLDGPPFSVSGEEVREQYGDSYEVTLLESTDFAGGLKGKCPATENAWLLR